jgi:hypothetical protein
MAVFQLKETFLPMFWSVAGMILQIQILSLALDMIQVKQKLFLSNIYIVGTAKLWQVLSDFIIGPRHDPGKTKIIFFKYIHSCYSLL